MENGKRKRERGWEGRGRKREGRKEQGKVGERKSEGRREKERKRNKSGGGIMVKAGKKSRSTRIVKQSHKSKKSAFLKRKILVISETLVAGKSTE